MNNFVFPSNIYDRPENLLSVLGSWWADDYAAKDQIRSVVDGKSQIESQSVLDLLETIAAMSRFSVPIYHTDTWYPLYLYKSQMNTSAVSPVRYDAAGQLYRDDLLYDAPQATQQFHFPAPEKLVNAPLIFNRFAGPTLTWQNNMHYTVAAGVITFLWDPFEDPRVARRAVYRDGVVVDTEAILWVFRGEFDWDTIYRQFGYAVGVRLQSSAGYRDILNAVYDAIIGGPAGDTVTVALSAMTGVPLVREVTETVQVIENDRRGLHVITDQHVYRFDAAANPVVAVGDKLQRFDAMTDALQIFELNTGITPADLAAVSLGSGFLATCMYADLIFENREVPLVVDTQHPSGYTYLSWALGGFPNDVTTFFEDMHARGVAAAQQSVDSCGDNDIITYPAPAFGDPPRLGRRGTLAHWLDSRPVRVGEPKAVNLPSTINPLKFLVENVLRNNAYIVKIRITAQGSQGVGLQNLRLLRKIVPPHTAMILIVAVTAETDSVTLDMLSDELSQFTGAAPQQDDVLNLVETSRVVVRIINGTCQ